MAILKALTSGGERRPLDFYPTPASATRALIPLIRHWPAYVWEPACGDGAISRILRANGWTVYSTDISPRGYGDVLDFLAIPYARSTTIVTNPPFDRATEFIEHACKIDIVRMALLLKIDFWNAASRLELWNRFTPSAIHPLTWRLDFTGAGRPHTNVQWCLWDRTIAPCSTVYRPLARPS